MNEIPATEKRLRLRERRRVLDWHALAIVVCLAAIVAIFVYVAVENPPLLPGQVTGGPDAPWW